MKKLLITLFVAVSIASWGYAILNTNSNEAVAQELDAPKQVVVVELSDVDRHLLEEIAVSLKLIADPPPAAFTLYGDHFGQGLLDALRVRISKDATEKLPAEILKEEEK